MEAGQLKSAQVKVLSHIKAHPGADLWEIRETTGISHQTATSALSSLMDEGLVKCTGERFRNDAHYSILHFVEDEAERPSIARERRFEKFLQWRTRGITDFSDILTRDARLAIMQNPLIF